MAESSSGISACTSPLAVVQPLSDAAAMVSVNAWPLPMAPSVQAVTVVVDLMLSSKSRLWTLRGYP
jgi:hypothetical protein